MRLGIGDERISAIKGDIEPLVAIGGPGIRLVHSLHEMPVARAGRGPQSERAIDVHPALGNASRSGINFSNGSYAPIFTSPACSKTIFGMAGSLNSSNSSKASGSRPPLFIHAKILHVGKPQAKQRTARSKVACR